MIKNKLKNSNRKFTAIFLVFSITVSSQSSFSNRTLAFFTSMWKDIPQEKVYLHTDKPYYNAGEEVWFKAYLINASTHLPNAKSKFVYVELINEFDSVLFRVKIKKDSVGFSGHLKLNPEIAPGNYVLRAYTYWMQNIDSDFFFNKQLKIGNSIDDKVYSSIKFGEIKNGFQSIAIQLFDANSKPIVDKPVKLTYNKPKKVKKNTSLISNQQGEILWRIPVDSAFSDEARIALSIDEASLKYAKQFKVPSYFDDFDVQFFPESGSLLGDNMQIVTFKAINRQGLSVEVSGKLYDAQNNEISDLKSIYKGMGKISIFVQQGTNYYALLKNENGLEKRFLLPKVEEGKITLQLTNNNKGKLFYDIKNNLANSVNTLYLLIHSRGVIYAIKPLNYFSGLINEDDLPAGITSFSVIDSLGNVFCERLHFVKNKAIFNIAVNSDKNSYKKREEVKLNFDFPENQGAFPKGDFSISVTDNKLIEQDSTSDNIESNLLLTSDIKGYIEKPADFFTENEISSREKLDLLMLTQGWRRFDLKNYLKQKYDRPEYYLEIGQAVSGKVLNLVNKPSKNCDIIMLTSYNNTFRMTSTDSLGKFIADGIEFPDSTSIMLKARKKKSITDIEIVPDIDVFPTPKVFIPYKQGTNNVELTEFLRLSKEKYYTEGGMRVINLDELTVTANSKMNSNEYSIYAGADNQISSKTLEKYSGMSILNYLQMVPGVSVIGETVSIRGSGGNPLFLIDGFETENIEDIMYLTTNEVEEIAVFKGPSAAIFGSRGGNGAIAITLKEGAVIKHSTPISLTIFNPLGFQKPSAFYMPKYEVEEVRNATKSDLRTTIFWGDKLQIDKNGKIEVHFYTADLPNNYFYVLEGITENGHIIHKSGIIKRDETNRQIFY